MTFHFASDHRPLRREAEALLAESLLLVLFRYTEEPRNSAFQGTCGFYALLREMPYCQYIELKEII